jgi:glutathionylspermidine synthase
MHLQAVQPRPNAETTNEALRFGAHMGIAKPEGWNESAVWSDHICVFLTEDEASVLHEATQRLHDMCMETAGDMITRGDYPAQMQLSEPAIRLIEASWKRGDPMLSGRFDLAYDGVHAPKLIEYNADNAGQQLEAAVLQAQWAYDKGYQQYNSLYPSLVDAWKNAQAKLAGDRHVHFATDYSVVDAAFVAGVHKLAATEAGIHCSNVDIRDIEWDNAQQKFMDPQINRALDVMFKVYGWNALLEDAYGIHLSKPGVVQTLEPAYTMLLENKGFLVALSERYPDHENLLLARHADSNSGMIQFAHRSVVKKPLVGNNGEGVQVKHLGAQFEGAGQGYIYQAYKELPRQHGQSVLTQTWVAGQKACAVNFLTQRSDVVSGPASRFVPHYICE